MGCLQRGPRQEPLDCQGYDFPCWLGSWRFLGSGAFSYVCVLLFSSDGYICRVIDSQCSQPTQSTPKHSIFSRQQVFISGGPFDMKRFITLSAFGFLYHGPSGHYFYNWLDNLIPGSDGKAVASKVAFDQIVWCPVFMTVFFTYLGLVNGDSFATIGTKIKNDLFSAMQGSWKVWPIVHAVNFKFISTKHRLVFINGVQVAFNMFLSLIGSK